jgi:hypothetical protein
LLTQIFISLVPFPFVDAKLFFLLSDDDDPKRDGAAAPLLDTLTITKAPSQEEAVVVKSPEVPPKKSTPVRASKRLKKAGQRVLLLRFLDPQFLQKT